MTVAALTSDSLKEPDREKTQLAKLNELASALNNVTGGGTPAAGTFTHLTLSENLELTGAGDTYIYDSLATTTGNQNLNLFAAGTGTVRINSATGGVSNAGTGGLEVYGGAGGAAVKVWLKADGSITFEGALDHNGSTAGFYGTAPIAKQTGVAVSAAGIHAALVALGLIGV